MLRNIKDDIDQIETYTMRPLIAAEDGVSNEDKTVIVKRMDLIFNDK